MFHYDPARVMSILLGPRGGEFVRTLWRDLAAELAAEERLDGPEPAVEVAAREGRQVVFVWMPAPAGVTECHAVALVTEPSGAAAGARGEMVPHYFTLERGEDLRGGARTVLCGWAEEGENFRHYNLGDGPEPAPAALLTAVRDHLDGRL